MEAIIPLLCCYSHERQVILRVEIDRCDCHRSRNCRQYMCNATGRKGHRTLLLDRQEFPRHKTCGEFMSPETKEMLEVLDIHLLDQSKKPSTMDHAKIVMPQGGVIEAPLPGFAYGISRYELDQILHQKALEAGAQIVTKATITSIEQFEDASYEVQVKQGDERISYRAKAVIGAHGTKKPRGMASSPDLRTKPYMLALSPTSAG